MREYDEHQARPSEVIRVEARRGNENAVRVLLVLAAGFIGFVAGALLITSLNRAGKKDAAPAPPAIAGAKVPAKLHTIDFTFRYDIICSSDRTYRNCRILGFTGEKKRNSGGYFSEYENYLEQWLVLELPDGRKAYVPPHQIFAFEQTKGR